MPGIPVRRRRGDCSNQVHLGSAATCFLPAARGVRDCARLLPADPIGETLITDGIFTIIGSILGSPFGTVIYFGHPVHKRLGGKYFFSAANGLIYLILTLTGIFPIFLDIIPKVAIGPTIFIFGLMLCEECTRCIPQRHHGVIFFALFFAWCDYFGNKGGPPSEEGAGLDVMRNGALLNAMLWTCILYYVVDRKWLGAAAFCCVAAFFAIIGLTHQPFIAFANTVDGNQVGDNCSPTEKRYSTSPLQIALAYLTVAGVNVMFYGLKKAYPESYPDPIEQGSDESKSEDKHAFNSKLVAIEDLDKWWAKGAENAEKEMESANA